MPCAAGACLYCEWAGGVGVQGSRVSAGGSEHSVAGGQAPWPAGQVSFRLGAHHFPGSHHLRSICGRCEPAGQRIASSCLLCVSLLCCSLLPVCFVCYLNARFYLHVLGASLFVCVSSMCLLCAPLAQYRLYICSVYSHLFTCSANLLCVPPVFDSCVVSPVCLIVFL